MAARARGHRVDTRVHSKFRTRTARVVLCSCAYRSTSPTRKRYPLGPYSRTMLRALWESWGGERFFMSEVPLYCRTLGAARVLNFE